MLFSNQDTNPIFLLVLHVTFSEQNPVFTFHILLPVTLTSTTCLLIDTIPPFPNVSTSMSLSHIFLNHNSCRMEQGLLAFSSLYLIFTCSDVQKATNKISKNLFCSSFKFSAPHLLYHLIIFFIILRCLDSALMDLSWRYRKGKGHDAFFIHRSSLCNINYILYSMKILVKPFKIYHINYRCKYLTFLACKTNS